MTGMLAIWDILSQVFLYWLGTLSFIVITILILMGVSMSFDTLSWAWWREGEPAAAAVEEAKGACGGEAEDAGAETKVGVGAGAGPAAAERGKGAKWKKSSRRAAERREREARSGRATPPFPLLLAKRRRLHAPDGAPDDASDAAPDDASDAAPDDASDAAPDKDDPDAIYAAALSASVKHLSRSGCGAEPIEDEGAPGGGGGRRTSDCADTDTESLRSRDASSCSSSSGSSSSEVGGASEGDGPAPAVAEGAPATPAERQQRGADDAPAATPVGAGAGAASDAETEAGADATRKPSEKAAAASDPHNMQVALLSNTKRDCYTARSMSAASFHATARADVRRLLSPYSSLIGDDRWEKMGLINVSRNRLLMSSLLPNARYFSATITKNNAMITTCLAAIDKLKQNATKKTLNSITNMKRKNITLSPPSEYSQDSARENKNQCNKSLNESSDGAKPAGSPLVTMQEQSSTEIFKKKLEAWNCVPPADIRSPTQSTVMSTLLEVSEMGSTNNLKPSEVKAHGTGSFVSSKIPKISSTPGNKAASTTQWKSNTRPKSANSPTKPNTPNKSTSLYPPKPNTPPKSPPLSAKRSPSSNTQTKGGKVQPNNSGTAPNFSRIPNPKMPTTKASIARSVPGNQQTPKLGTLQGSPVRNPPQGSPTKNSPQLSPTKNPASRGPQRVRR